MKVLAIITARGGSKRVPGKNIKLLNGIPLIAHTIKAAQEATLLHDIIVSTDDEEIARVAKQYGGNVPFIRPSNLATDTTGDQPVLLHALTKYLENKNAEIDAICFLRPTSPFRTGALIDEGIELLMNSKAEAVRSMTKVQGVHHPYWMYREENGIATGVVPEISVEEYYQSQLLPPVYRLNGCVDIIRTSVLLDDSKGLYGNAIKIMEISEQEGLDIDTPEDFDYCEWLFERK